MEIKEVFKGTARELTKIFIEMFIVSNCLGPLSPSGIRLNVEGRIDQSGYGITRERWDRDRNLGIDLEVFNYYCDGKKFKVAVYNRFTGELFVDRYMHDKYRFRPIAARTIIPSMNSGIESCLEEVEQINRRNRYQL